MRLFGHNYVKTAPKLCKLTRLRAMQLMACSCAMTILKPNLLFMMARRHIIQTWISSVVSPIFSLVECRIHLFIRGPSKSLLSLFFELTVPKITEDFLLDLKNNNKKFSTIFENYWKKSHSHCSKSSFFVQKINFDFPTKIVELFRVKNSWKCCGFGLFSCW